MKFQPIREKTLFTSLFITGKTKWNFVSGLVRDKRSIQEKPITLVCACADVSFHMISIWVVFTWCFITKNKISFLSKWPQWNNTLNYYKFHFELLSCNGYRKLTSQRNKISRKHLLKSFTKNEYAYSTF